MTELRKQSESKDSQIAKSKSIFQRMLSFFSWSRKQSEPVDERYSLFELRQDAYSFFVLSEVRSHIQLYQLLGYQVKEALLNREIPDEYIGVVSCWHGKILVSQEYLKIQVEYVEKKSLVGLKIPPSTEAEPFLYDQHNIYTIHPAIHSSDFHFLISDSWF